METIVSPDAPRYVLDPEYDSDDPVNDPSFEPKIASSEGEGGDDDQYSGSDRFNHFLLLLIS